MIPVVIQPSFKIYSTVNSFPLTQNPPGDLKSPHVLETARTGPHGIELCAGVFQ